MPLTYLIDEHLRGDLSIAFAAAGLAQGLELDNLQIGDEDAPALGIKDPPLLRWCESHERVPFSRDVRSLPIHLADHLAGGHMCPGIFILRPGKSWHDVLDDLVLLALVMRPDECRDRIIFVPL